MPRSKEFLEKHRNDPICEATRQSEARLFALEKDIQNPDGSLNVPVYHKMFEELMSMAKSMIVQRLGMLKARNGGTDIIPKSEYLQYIEEKSIGAALQFMSNMYGRYPERRISSSFSGLLKLKVLNEMHGQKDAEQFENLTFCESDESRFPVSDTQDDPDRTQAHSSVSTAFLSGLDSQIRRCCEGNPNKVRIYALLYLNMMLNRNQNVMSRSMFSKGLDAFLDNMGCDCSEDVRAVFGL